jgi:phenylacetate-CoA ligase
VSGGFWDARVEMLGRDELRALQDERLRRQVRRCYEGSALFRRKLDEAGARPQEIAGLEQLQQLPVVTKDELRADQAERPPFGSLLVAPPESLREMHPSTGTTGTPVNTAWSQRDVETIAHFTARTLWQFGVRPGDVIQNAFAYGLWVAGMSCHHAAARLGCLVIPTGATTATERQIAFLVHAAPTVLLATPSFALHIAERLQESGIDPAELALARGCFGGEPGAGGPAGRDNIERGLGIEAFDYYGLAEIAPTFASECEAKAGIHFAEDHVLVECLDPETRTPVGDGELGVLVFTHLTREATPLLRYWSNDYARLSHERCACGRTHVRAVGGILGRHDDLIIFRGAKFYPSQIEQVLGRFDALGDAFVIEVTRPGPGQPVSRCTVLVEAGSEPAGRVPEDLTKRLRAELGATPEVRIVPHGTLERTAFKAQRIVEAG